MDTDITESWPPPLRLRRSLKAKYLRISISATNEVELVVPRGATKADALDFLNSKKPWVLKQLKKNADKVIVPPLPEHHWPFTLNFRALNMRYALQYKITSASHIRISMVDEYTLMISGPLLEPQAIFHALKKWVKKQGQWYLPIMLNELSVQIGLGFSGVSVRGQKSRWGSCSSKGAISLNYKSLFLPKALCEHVIIHELCHTVHLDHSSRFWGLLTEHDPKTQLHREQLKQGDQFVPGWL